MYVIVKQDLIDENISIEKAYYNLDKCKSYIHDLNDQYIISYRDSQKRYIRMYKKGYIYNSLIAIFKIIEIPECADEVKNVGRIKS